MEMNDQNTNPKVVEESQQDVTDIGKQPEASNSVDETKPSKTYFKSFESEQDWNDYSKILEDRFTEKLCKDFNVESIKELSDLLGNYKSTNETLEKELAEIRQEAALSGVEENFKEDCLAIAMCKCSKDPKLTLNAAIAEVLKKNPNWAKGKKPENLGLEKTETDTEQRNKVLDEFLRRNPELRDQFYK